MALFQSQIFDNLNSSTFKPSSYLLTIADVKQIQQFVYQQCFNTAELLSIQSTMQSHRTVTTLIHNILDFVLQALPATKESADYISDWIYTFFR